MTACLARLWSSISVIRLQLLLSSQYSESEIKEWGLNLNREIKRIHYFPDIEPILKRLSEEPNFALQDLKHHSLSSGILGFTSTVEYYLKDIIILSLRRNQSLRKKGFKDLQISALKLEEFDDINAIKKSQIEILANLNSKGELFRNKIKKACSFLNIDKASYENKIIDNLDSLWELRNKFAHLNQKNIDSYKITSLNGVVSITREASKEDYLNFVAGVAEIFTEAIKYLKVLDNKICETWPADEMKVE